MKILIYIRLYCDGMHMNCFGHNNPWPTDPKYRTTQKLKSRDIKCVSKTTTSTI